MSSLPLDRRDLLTALLGPGEPELTCDDCFEQLDRYVDLQHAGANADHAIPGMRAHLIGCPACRHDHASLLELVTIEDERDCPRSCVGMTELERHAHEGHAQQDR